MLSVKVGERPEDLVAALVDGLHTPLADPFQTEWISVPSLGFRSWLRFRLAERLDAGPGPAAQGSAAQGSAAQGIAANLDLPFPGTLRWLILGAHARHLGLVEDVDPWQVERLVWSVMAVLLDPEAEVDDRLRRSRLPTGATLASRAGPIADLFDRYGVHRPHMVQAWAEGRDLGPDGQSIATTQAWQPGLYRSVRAHIVATHGVVPPAERLAEALDLVARDQLPLTDTIGRPLPERLFVVGQSILPAELGPIVQAVAVQRSVNVLLLSPSATSTVRWAQHAANTPRPSSGPGSWSFPRDFTEITCTNPLLRRWGGRPLESALLLGAGGVVPEALPTATAEARPTLLRRVQAHVRADEEPTPQITPDPAEVSNPSLEIHAAPGATRQVEVLRDVILGLLRDIPGLTESDIAIVCPQLPTFAPTISAVLGPPAAREDQPQPGTVPALRYTVIDRDARSFNPVLSAMTAVIELIPGRFDTSSVRDLLHAPAVQERFGLTTDDLDLLSRWIDDARIRWGLDGHHRVNWGIDPRYRGNSWAAGVDQLMMGVALGDPLQGEPLPGDPIPKAPATVLAVGGIAPMGLSESAIASAGRLTAAVRSLALAHELLTGSPAAGTDAKGPGPDAAQHTMVEWQGLLVEVADLLVQPERFEDWQRARFDDALADLVAASADSDGQPSALPLTFGDVRRLLAPALDGQRVRADLGYGSVVIARPAVLAGVPFRVVCVLGLDEDALPGGSRDGDDLLLAQPFVGDREPRAEARAELLGAVLAAGDHLVITCNSRDVRTNESVPHSVVLDELLDTAERSVGPRYETVPDEEAEGEADQGESDQPESEQRKSDRQVDGGAPFELVRSHPRQGFDPSNFTTEGAPPFSFDPTALDGARALVDRARAGSATHDDTLVSLPLGPSVPTDLVELADLHRFYEHPVRRFFRQVLNIYLPEDRDELETVLPTAIGGLDAWAIGSALLEEAARREPDQPGEGMAGITAATTTFESRGVLPPPAAALPALEDIATEVRALIDQAEAAGVATDQPASTVPIDLLLPSQRRVRGVVTGCQGGLAWQPGDPLPGPVVVGYSRFKPKVLVGLAIDLLALTAVHPELPWRAVAVTRGKPGKGPAICEMSPIGEGPHQRQAVCLTALDLLLDQYVDGHRLPLPLFDQTSYYRIQKPHEGHAASQWGNPVGQVYGSGPECRDVYHQAAFGALSFNEVTRLDLDGHTFDGEARRLWGTLQTALTIESVE